MKRNWRIWRWNLLIRKGFAECRIGKILCVAELKFLTESDSISEIFKMREYREAEKMQRVRNDTENGVVSNEQR